ncbi:MAG: trypsin-like serine protease, partial [Polyangiaceae bacterium]
MTPNNDGSNTRPLTVASAHIHPGWTECPNCGCNTWLCDMVDKPDVALVIVNEDTPDVPEAAIDDTPVAAGDGVVMTGYGCDNGTNRPSTSPGLKIHNVVAYDPLVYSSAGVAASYVVTQGIADDPNSASLCPGDSGGPLYRQGHNRQLVVGINALLAYTNEAGISFANWAPDWIRRRAPAYTSGSRISRVNAESGASCGDGVKNGSETDVDCGGTCAKCEDASTCSVAGAVRIHRVSLLT